MKAARIRTGSSAQAQIVAKPAAIVVLAIASLVGGFALTAAAGAHGSPTQAAPALGPAAASVEAELAGIPQHALIIGPASAKVTVSEYADLVCVPCAHAAASVVAPAIESFASSGAARFQFEPIVESPQSESYALGAYAAGVQHEGWDYVMLAYLCSTTVSNGPLFTAPTLAGALGLDMPRWRGQLRDGRWLGQIEESSKVALYGDFTAYPVFIIRGPGIHPGPMTQGRSVLILHPPVTTAALGAAIQAAEPPGPSG